MMQKIFNFLNSIFITQCRVVGTFLPRTTFCSPPSFFHLTHFTMPSRIRGRVYPVEILHLIFSFLSLFEINRSMTCSKKMRDILLDCQMYVSPTHVVEVVDKLIASQKIIEAERLIRLYIARFPNKKTPVILLNRYILIIHADLWASEQYQGTRMELFGHFKGKSMSELIMSEQTSGNPTESTSFQEMLAGMESVTMNLNPCSIGNKFENKVFPPTQYAKIGRICNGEEIYVPTHPLPTVSGEATCLLAYICFKNKDYVNAGKLIKKAAEYDPNAILYLWLNGVLQHYLYQNFEASCHSYTCAITVAPDFAYSYYSLGVLASNSGDNVKSEFLYQQCLKLDPHHHYALLNRLIHCDDADHPDVHDMYRKIIQIHPSELIAYRAFAKILLNNPTQQNIDEAERVLKQGIRIDEGACNGFIWYDLGNLFRIYKIDIIKSNFYFNNFVRVSNNEEIKQDVMYLIQRGPGEETDEETDDYADDDTDDTDDNTDEEDF